MRNILTLLIVLGVNLTFAQKKINIVFVGNSITQGALIKQPAVDSPPAQCVKILNDKGYEVNYANCGVSGATTVDFLPAAETLFVKVANAAGKMSGRILFSVSLGTNDSASTATTGAPISAAQYYVNLKAITDELTKLYADCLIVIHYPIWYSSNTYNSAMYLEEGQKRLLSYRPMIERLASEFANIYVGDTAAYAFFEHNYLENFFAENGRAGTFYLHPNEAGAKKLAQYWANPIIGILTQKSY